MRRLLLILCMVLCAGQAWGAIYYIDKIAGTVRYSTSGWPTGADGTETLQTLINISSAGDVFILGGGAPGGSGISYTATELDSDNGLTINKAVQFRGCKSSDTGYAEHGGAVTLDATSGAVHTLTVTAAATVENLRVLYTGANNQYALSSTTNAATFNDVYLFGNWRTFQSTAASTFNRCTFEHSLSSTTYAGYINASATFNYCKFINASRAWLFDAGSPVFNNCLFFGSGYSTLQSGGTATVSVNNSIFAQGNGWNYGGLATINQTGGTGTFTLNNCLTYPNAQTFLETISAGVTETNAITVSSPKFTHSRRGGIIVFAIDDRTNIDYATSVLAKLHAYGWHGSFGFSSPSSASASDWTKANSMVANGHDIAVHGETFSNDTTSLTGIRINYGGAGTTATVTITSSGGYATRLITTIDGATDKDLDLTNASYNTLPKVVTAINGGDYTCTKLNADSGNVASKYLADAAGTNIKATNADMALSSTRVYNGEFTDTKTAIEGNVYANGISGAAYVVKSHIAPGNKTDSGIKAALLARDYKIARGLYTFANGSFSMTNLDMFNVVAQSMSVVFGAGVTEPTVAVSRTKLGALIERVKYLGEIHVLYAHDATEFTLTGWDNLLQSVAEDGEIKVLSLSEAYDYIAANGSTADSGATYTRTFTDQSDYRLQSGSPAINAGVVVSGVHPGTDYAGNPNYRGSAPDIGAYEKSLGGLFTTTNRFNVFAPHRRLH